MRRARYRRDTRDGLFSLFCVLRWPGPLALAGGALVSDVVTVENELVFGIVALCLGFGLVIFGVVTQTLWRAISAAANPNNELPSEDTK